MNRYLLLAAVLSFVLALGHSLREEWIGKLTLVRRIMKLRLFDEGENDVMMFF